VVHLGDYIYEGAQLGERAHNPPRIIFSLWDYRTRHGQVRNRVYHVSDQDLGEVTNKSNSTALIPTCNSWLRTTLGCRPGMTTV
jgi:hypothetical protein